MPTIKCLHMRTILAIILDLYLIEYVLEKIDIELGLGKATPKNS